MQPRDAGVADAAVSAAPSGLPSAAAPTRPATAMLREFIELSEQFERVLGAELAVNPTDLNVMEQLLMSGPLGASEIARRVGISAGAATTAVDRLVALGHVTRQAQPHDRRGVLVVAQPASRDRAMGRLMPMILGIDAQLDSFSAEEQETITRYLRQVVEHLGHHASVSPPSTTPG